jgi:hypothetical protein
MENNQVLPPLPRSDKEAMSKHTFDSFYQRSSQGFWEGNEITRIEVGEMKKCDHEFIRRGHEVECKKCHFGLIGPIEIQNGKLFHRGEPLGI